jgi:hypothetical protein
MSKEKDIKAEIVALKSKLTGDLLNDAEVQSQIYQLKIILNPEIANRPDLDDEDCLYCGS